MRTTTLILTAAVVAATTLISCGKKDSGDEQQFAVSKEAVTVEAGKIETLKVTAKSTTVRSENSRIATASPVDGTIIVEVKGVSEGTTNLTISEGSHRATVKVTVTPKKDNNPSAVLQVDKSILFLQKGKEIEITNRVTKSSGSVTISNKNTPLFTWEARNNRLYVKGVGEGLSGVITIKDNGTGETADIPVYVIVPFEAPTLPAELTVGDNQTVALSGVYTTTLQAGRYDRVAVTANNGRADITLVTTEVKDNVGLRLGYVVTGFTLTGKTAGDAVITLTNGDGQTLTLNFRVVAYETNTYFDVDADGKVSLKSSTTKLPAKITFPANAKIVPEKLLQGQTAVKEIDFNNVVEIEGNLFNNMANPVGINVEKVIMRKVEKVGYDTFRYANKLVKIEFPATLKQLGNQALVGCTALRAVAFRGTTLPQGVTSSGSPTTLSGVLDTDAGNRRRLFVPASQAKAYSDALGSTKFRYTKGLNKDWYAGDTGAAVVDISNYDLLNF